MPFPWSGQNATCAIGTGQPAERRVWLRPKAALGISSCIERGKRWRRSGSGLGSRSGLACGRGSESDRGCGYGRRRTRAVRGSPTSREPKSGAGLHICFARAPDRRSPSSPDSASPRVILSHRLPAMPRRRRRDAGSGMALGPPGANAIGEDHERCRRAGGGRAAENGLGDRIDPRRQASDLSHAITHLQQCLDR